MARQGIVGLLLLVLAVLAPVSVAGADGDAHGDGGLSREVVELSGADIDVTDDEEDNDRIAISIAVLVILLIAAVWYFVFRRRHSETDETSPVDQSSEPGGPESTGEA